MQFVVFKLRKYQRVEHTWDAPRVDLSHATRPRPLIIRLNPTLNFINLEKNENKGKDTRTNIQW